MPTFSSATPISRRPFFEGLVICEIERNVGLALHGISSADDYGVLRFIKDRLRPIDLRRYQHCDEVRRRLRGAVQCRHRSQHDGVVAKTAGGIQGTCQESGQELYFQSEVTTKGLAGWVLEPVRKAVVVRLERSGEQRLAQFGFGHLRPAVPALVERENIVRPVADLFGEPALRGDGLFEPLFKVAGIERLDVLPALLG